MRSTFGNISPGKVRRKSNAIRNTDMIGDCSTMPAGDIPALHSFCARYSAGPEPTDLNIQEVGGAHGA